ncbi:MAG: hypothetical protein WDW36_007615 [Sanguina aurantia]
MTVRHTPRRTVAVQLPWRLVDRGTRAGVPYSLYESRFKVYDALSSEVRTAHVQLLVPAGFDPSGNLNATFGQQPPSCVLHLAGTGDHGFQRRIELGFPLLKQNISTLVLESPFYGSRKPAGQKGSKLLSVTDLLLLGLLTISEGLHLLHWASLQGFASLGLCGLSMGGVHACMLAGLCPLDVALAALLTPRSAAVAYCDGAMRNAIAWSALQDVGFDAARNSIDEVIDDAPVRPEASWQTLQPGGSVSGCGDHSHDPGVVRVGAHTTSESIQPALQQLRRVLEAFTDIRSYPMPQRPDAIVLVAAANDAYVSQQSVASLKQHYPNATLRFVPGGHVSAFLTQKPAFRTAIVESINRELPCCVSPACSLWMPDRQRTTLLLSIPWNTPLYTKRGFVARLPAPPRHRSPAQTSSWLFDATAAVADASDPKIFLL